jgi:hypothetical protein
MAEPMSVMNLRAKGELFEEIAQIMGIAQSFVEMDWYVVHIWGSSLALICNAGNGV